MNLYDRVKNLSDDQEIAISRLEQELGFGNGTIRKWAKTIPSGDRLQKVADYFHVSVDYLLGREDNKDDVFFLRGGDKLTKEEKEELKNIMQMSADVYLRAKGLIK